MAGGPAVRDPARGAERGARDRRHPLSLVEDRTSECRQHGDQRARIGPRAPPGRQSAGRGSAEVEVPSMRDRHERPIALERFTSGCGYEGQGWNGARDLREPLWAIWWNVPTVPRGTMTVSRAPAGASGSWVRGREPSRYSGRGARIARSVRLAQTDHDGDRPSKVGPVQAVGVERGTTGAAAGARTAVAIETA